MINATCELVCGRITAKVYRCGRDCAHGSIAISKLNRGPTVHAVGHYALDGHAAVKLAQEQRFDCIVMDCQMPIMDGYETTRRIKSFNKQLPIIAQTAFAMDEDEKKCLEAGCDDYIKKPVNIEELLTKINKYIKKRPS